MKTKLRTERAGALRRRTSAGSYAVGVQGTISGFRADCLILDDVVHDEGTPNERESTWRWVTEIAYPRLNAGGAIVAVNTRGLGRRLRAHPGRTGCEPVGRGRAARALHFKPRRAGSQAR